MSKQAITHSLARKIRTLRLSAVFSWANLLSRCRKKKQENQFRMYWQELMSYIISQAIRFGADLLIMFVFFSFHFTHSIFDDEFSAISFIAIKWREIYFVRFICDFALHIVHKFKADQIKLSFEQQQVEL